jgi:hypothetical protein
MIVVTTIYRMAWPGSPAPASAGQTVSATIPAGCVLRRSTDLQTWDDVATAVPFTHTGADAHYRIDCVTYTAPVTATLSIGA